MRSCVVLVGIAAAFPIGATAQENPDSVIQLEAVSVSVDRADLERLTPTQRLTLPVTSSVTARRIQETVNLIDTEDAVKYLPSLFLRKRNNGDTQATLATRVWGVSSSARSLIFADGVPLSALIANNNTLGGPRWGLIAPVEIERIDVMHGPFSAAYAGNSMGAVMEITTRLPSRREGSLTQTQAFQSFDLYGTKRTYGTTQTAATFGARRGRFAFWVNGSRQSSRSQPLGYVTSATFPTGTTGGFAERNKLGAPANVLGATGLLHTTMTNGTLRLAYDVTPVLRASWRGGLWRNESESGVESYLARSGTSTYAGQAGFATGSNVLDERHFGQSFSLRTDTHGTWDAEAVATRYRFDHDRQRSPTTASATEASVGSAGRVAVLDGTGWETVDLRGTWRPAGARGAHALTGGAHVDRYRLQNPTYNTADWRAAEPVYSGVATEGSGRTRTGALWAQEVWRVRPTLKIVAGGRWEWWRAYDGYNANGATQVRQPAVAASRFSPKGVVEWAPVPRWTVTASVGKAYRFPTAAELYQLVSTGTTFTSPAPDLKPDAALSSEIRFEGSLERARVQLSLFQDDVHDAIISQFLPLVPGSTTLYSYLSNVDHVRARGIEVQLITTDLGVRGLELSGSATLVDAKTLALSGSASASAPAGSAVGKQLPNIPRRRASLVATYRPAVRLAFTLAGRYSDKLYTTLDNADTNPNTYQGFASWTVADARASWRPGDRLTVSAGVDNLFNRKYFLFHPFPQRTIVLEARAAL